MKSSEGFIGVDSKPRELIGKTGVADSILRPAGKVVIDDEIYDAKAEYGYISKGEKVKVVKYEAGQVYVVKTEN
jgi:membrane-bound serine protease (ClpP class)